MPATLSNPSPGNGFSGGKEETQALRRTLAAIATIPGIDARQRSHDAPVGFTFSPLASEDAKICHWKADGRAKYEVARTGNGGSMGLFGALVLLDVATERAEKTYRLAMKVCLKARGYDLPNR